MTAAATLPKTGAKPLGPMIRELKELVTEHGSVAKKLTRLETRVFILTQETVDTMIAQNKARNINEAAKMLADTVHRKWTTVQWWYLNGCFIRDHKLPKTVSGYVVSSARRVGFRNLSQASKLKVIQMMKDDASCEKIKAAIRKALPAEAAVRQRMRNLGKQGRFTRKELRMQMMALRTLAQKVLDNEELHVCITDNDYIPLEEL